MAHGLGEALAFLDLQREKYNPKRREEIYQILKKNPLTIKDIKIGDEVKLFSGLEKISKVKYKEQNYENTQKIKNNLYLVLVDSEIVRRSIIKNTEYNQRFTVAAISKKDKILYFTKKKKFHWTQEWAQRMFAPFGAEVKYFSKIKK